MKKVIHQISLNSIGGVQQLVLGYYKLASKKSCYKHEVFGVYPMDKEYAEVDNYVNAKGSFFSAAKFFYALMNKQNLFQFYNNIGSPALSKMLQYSFRGKCLLHEQGNAWNTPQKNQQIYINNVERAECVIVNSKATMRLIKEKFLVPQEKIKLVYNAVPFPEQRFMDLAEAGNKKIFESKKRVVGFIGRINTSKGLHVLVEAAKKLVDNKDIVFKIAGDGVWLPLLKEQSKGFENIKYVGRIKDPYEFISSVDLVLMPSIREPFGNVAAEAGICKKPIIAAKVDGLAEIIDNEVNGILIKPTKPLSIKELPENATPVPEFVVDPETGELGPPKEIDADLLAECIENLLSNPELMNRYGENLYKKVVDRFLIDKYFEELEGICKSILG